LAIALEQPLAQASYSPGELDPLVLRVALYPDPLLAQILAAATYLDQIPDAARWADQHHCPLLVKRTYPAHGIDPAEEVRRFVQSNNQMKNQGKFGVRQCSITLASADVG
jgi:hypothetical protein